MKTKWRDGERRDKSSYGGLTCQVNKWKWSSGKKKKALLFLLRTDFISSYSPPYPSRHTSLEPTAFPQTAPPLVETKPSRAWDEIREKDGGRDGGGSNLGQAWRYLLNTGVGSGRGTWIKVSHWSGSESLRLSPFDSQIKWERLCLLLWCFPLR